MLRSLPRLFPCSPRQLVLGFSQGSPPVEFPTVCVGEVISCRSVRALVKELLIEPALQRFECGRAKARFESAQPGFQRLQQIRPHKRADEVVVAVRNATSRGLNTHSSSTYAHMARSPARAPMAAGRAPMANSSGLTPRSRKTRRAYGRSSRAREGSSGPAELGTAGASTGRAPMAAGRTSMPAGQAAAGPATGARALADAPKPHVANARSTRARCAIL